MTNQKWASLHNHSDLGSLLDGLSKPEDLILRAVDVNIPALALTDHGSMAGIIKWQKGRGKALESLQFRLNAAKDPETKDLISEKIEKTKAIRLINGCEVYVKVDDKTTSHLVILAKNHSGYKDLVKMVSEATRKENFYRKPRLSLEQIAGFNKDKNLISFSGHIGSDLANILFENLNDAYNASTYEEAKSFVRDDWKPKLLAKVDEYIQTFGKENFYLEIQNFDEQRMPAQMIVARTLRWLSKQLKMPCVGTCDSHYVTQDRAVDQQILIANMLKTTLPRIRNQIINSDEIALGGFFKSDKYYLLSPEEISLSNTEEEMRNSIEIVSRIEDYSLANKPAIPKFTCPDGVSSDEYMKQLCRIGWKDKFSHLKGQEKEVYAERVNRELTVLQTAGLSDYFLIVQDIMNWTKSRGYMTGPGRGSAAGCLVSYLLGITAIDPIKHNLSFERFYNVGRNSPGRVSLPDIDCDIQGNARPHVVQYVKSKYGNDNVGQISNYGRLMGRSCLKDVLRAHEACSAEEMNRICSFLVDESAISDDLQEMEEEEEGSSSIIQWGLENNSEELAEWCWITENGKLDGPLSVYFEQAMRIEGTYKQKSKHAAGYVIYPENITTICPVIYTKDGDCEIAWDMHDVEWTGGVKLDILNVWIMDKVADAQFSIQNEFLLEQ